MADGRRAYSTVGSEAYSARRLEATLATSRENLLACGQGPQRGRLRAPYQRKNSTDLDILGSFTSPSWTHSSNSKKSFSSKPPLNSRGEICTKSNRRLGRTYLTHYWKTSYTLSKTKSFYKFCMEEQLQLETKILPLLTKKLN